MRPILSVIIASWNSRATIGRTLASLERQTGTVTHEVIVADSSTDGTADWVAREFPLVQMVRSARRCYAGEARNLGAAVAQGEIFALLDADCTVHEDWADQVVKAHEMPHPVIGGVVENGNPSSVVGWAYYFTEFSQWLPGSAAGFVTEVPGCSMTLKRTAFERWGPFMSGGYSSDTDFIWRMAADGHRPWLEPAIRIAHHNPTTTLALLRHEPEHGRHFARLRARTQLSRGGAMFRAVTAPLLPAVLWVRTANRALRSPGHFGRFLATSPLTLAAMAGWAWGEMRGYVDAVMGQSPVRAAPP